MAPCTLSSSALLRVTPLQKSRMSREALTPEKSLPDTSARHPGQKPEGGWVHPAPPEFDAGGAGPGSSAEPRQQRPRSPPLGVGLGETVEVRES